MEALCRRLGLPNPMLTPSQVRHNSVRWMQRIVSPFSVRFVSTVLRQVNLFAMHTCTHYTFTVSNNFHIFITYFSLCFKGRVIGVTIGCLLGMCPLFWFDQEPHSDSKSEDSNNSNNNNTSA